jgi:cytochrome c oxidase accessory protein FixG
MKPNQTPNWAEDNSTEEIQYFAKQKKIYPKRVSGFFRDLKWLTMLVTLGIYYFAPFLRYDRGPNAPDQAILIDLPNRRAYWYFVEIWPQEVYILTGILILAAIILFFVTSLFGRVWCGYFCPQTVWTDLFVWVERFVQGDRFARKKLQEGLWTFEKIWKIALTHAGWLVIAWLTAGSFILYFTDAPTFVSNFINFEITKTQLGFMLGLTFSTYLMAGFAREQVCTYMCPYARFQSAMFDENTLIIGYDEQRGEPRGKHKKGDGWDNRGHCIDCTACVQVCPMGIDIRGGLQMECIACGLCIDACDDVMEKLELPKGLIRYDTTRRLQLMKKGIIEEFKLLRPRTIYYSVIISLIGCAMLYTLVMRAPLELHVLHDRNPLYVKMSDGDVRNGYDIKILNKTHDLQSYTLLLHRLENASLTFGGAGDVTADGLKVAPGQVGHFRVFVKAPPTNEDMLDITFQVISHSDGFQDETESVFISRKEVR